jgi:hypothetical protein
MNRSTLSLFVLIGLATTALASPDVLLQPGKLLADIGVGATVPANPVNTYLQQLTEREQELALREQALRLDGERQALWIALAVVAGLVAVNFILDWKRNRV